jgi:hypothetical protein
MPKKTEFKRTKLNDDWVYEKPLDDGACIRKETVRAKEFYAYDRCDNYLGHTDDQRVAEEMAVSGHPNSLTGNCANPLDLWELWQVVAHGDGAMVYGNKEGDQFIYLDNGVFMRASPSNYGWDVELMSDATIEEQYFCAETGYYELTVVNASDVHKVE